MIDIKWARIFGITFAISTLTVAGCHRGVQAASQDPNQGQYQGYDPADQNMAPVDGSAAQQAPINESQQQAIQYGNGSAPVVRQAPGSYDPYAGQTYDQAYDPYADQGPDPNLPVLEADQAPPVLLEYDQPEAPGPDYIWTPGYWSWSPAGYYWVPGVWVSAPYEGALWTPGYWYFTAGRYRFHYGYWGLYIGFYGGINYGYGYFGTGYHGGYWNGPHFYYNTSITRVNVTRVTYVYRRPPPVYVQSRVSFNGGRGGVEVRPRPAEIAAMRTVRTPPMTAQMQVRREAEQNRQQFYNQNRGRPEMTVAARPVAADRGISRPAPIQTAGPRPGFQPNGQSGQRPDYRQGQESRPGSQPQNGQTQSGFRPGQPNGQVPNGQVVPNNQAPNNQPRPQSEIRPNQQTPDQSRPPRPQPEVRPTPQQPAIQNQPRPQPQASQPQVRPNPPAQFDSQPGSKPSPQIQVQPPSRPNQQPYQQRDFRPGQSGQDNQSPPPQSQLRHEGQGQPSQPHLQPQGQPQPQSQPQQQFRPQPQQQPQQQFRPQPQQQQQQQPQQQPHPQAQPAQPHPQGQPQNNERHNQDK